jgi:tetratricopeptide (TPR) repeat protein
MITIQILVRNDENTIRAALESLGSLDARIVVGDLGSRDGTLSICRSFGADVVKPRWDNDYSKIRNELASDGLNMYLDPWEVLAKGHELIAGIEANSAVYVVRNGMVSKEIRLWAGSSFVNPVYETIVDKDAQCFPGIAVIGGPGPDLREERSRIVADWMQRNPTSPEPYYYTAISRLENRKYEDFCAFARQYLAMEKNAGATAVMLYYHIAQIELHTGDLGSAVNQLLRCLSLHPDMAEFWCLLGDMLYKVQKYENAAAMYENAMILGKRRRGDDPYPVDVAKYGVYPSKMIQNIKNLLDDTGLIISKSDA